MRIKCIYMQYHAYTHDSVYTALVVYKTALSPANVYNIRLSFDTSCSVTWKHLFVFTRLIGGKLEV